MIVAGLTGSIGMGKSVLASQLRRLGVPVHASDEAVHRLLARGGAAVPAIRALWPKTVENGAVDRKKLGVVVFSDPAARQRLESILHPLVRRESERFLREQRRKGMKIAVLDIPLLYETGQAGRFDHVICVTAPHFVQKRRVLSRKNMTEDRFNTILKLQIPDAIKRARADSVINTAHGYRGSLGTLKKVLKALSAAKTGA
ncbi:MAG: dephospho-CoA kinase [Rhodospirillales bacterium]|nr:dephospho-CoA kinase [Alphaproteobacteria bacterium]MCB9986604.1 dephospho-CoA kinase [Rhodospirillales bacterium]USO06866.1 MAG: dephospho-CoA kinase [Rhodospirillales bacterium]